MKEPVTEVVDTACVILPVLFSQKEWKCGKCTQIGGFGALACIFIRIKLKCCSLETNILHLHLYPMIEICCFYNHPLQVKLLLKNRIQHKFQVFSLHSRTIHQEQAQS